MQKIEDDTEISFVRNVKNSFLCTLLGLILFITSSILLWSNEFDYAKNIELAKFIKNNCISVNAANISKLNNNRLVTAHDYARTQEPLDDGLIKVKQAIALIRTVEMYQWQEVKRTVKEDLGGGRTKRRTEYIYKPVWSKKLINSEKFITPENHTNPNAFPVQSLRMNSDKVTLGAYNLNKNEIEQIENSIKITRLPYNEKYRIYNGFYFSGMDFDSPSIGDIKISYRYIPTNIPVTVIAMQNNNNLEPYINKKYTVDIASYGIKSEEEMINGFVNNNSIRANIFRFSCFMLILLAMKLFACTLSVITNSNVFINKISDYINVTGGLIISAGITGIIVSSAWIQYHPEIAIPALIISVCIILFLPRKKHILID